MSYLATKQFEGKLFKEISSEFTTNAVQITRTIANGKTFYFVKAKLYPVVNTIFGDNNLSIKNRRADIEIKFDGTIIDVLTYDFESNELGANRAAWGNSNQLESLVVDSMIGNGVKKVEVTSTDTSGTFRVSLMGFEENTGTAP